MKNITMPRYLYILSMVLTVLMPPVHLQAQEKGHDTAGAPTVSRLFVQWKTDSLELAGSKLWFADSVLLSNRSLSVTALTKNEVPRMDYGMVNVTAGGEGYRYLPHGTHFGKEGATVSLRFDRSRIPAGYTERDIYTFYYDEHARHWVALERIGIDSDKECIVSRTTHFTDMINGIIQAPEMPETEGFAPTMMNDLQAADPAAKMNLIAPPTANSHGTANLAYPFEMPPARNGMTPQLGLLYNSDGGSGWLGEGWDVPVPAITVDTRWGVPRYDTVNESETYLMNGAMLCMKVGSELTVAHRDTTVARTADRQFFTRQEGDFSRIIRKGSSPSAYYWEVTDKNGVKYTYGGTENSRLQSADGKTAEWRLSRIEETHGDYTTYEYTKSEEVIAGSVTAKAIYLSTVNVYHKGISVPVITVTFTSGQEKTIKANSGRYGFLSSQNKLLTEVEVEFKNQTLRKYVFAYEDGSFGKNLLSSVTHQALRDNGSGLEDFSTQQFSYYEDSGSGGIFGTTTNTLNVTDDGIGSLFSISTLTQDGRNEPTAIGGTATTSASASVYAGFGPYDPLPYKTGTAGMSAGVSLDKTNGTSTLVDINGDGIPDKLFRKSGHVYARLASMTANGIEYGQDHLLAALDGFLTTTSLSTSSGGKASVGSGAASAMTGSDVTKTRISTSEYLMDINGDGLVDYVDNGTVYFNHLDANGIPTFTVSSSDTPNPLGNTGSVNSTLIDDDTSDEQEMEDASPMMDVVRFWEAPRDGQVSLSGTITNEQVADDSYDEADGVRAAVQIGGTEIWSRDIAKGGSASYSLINRTVTKGQRIYFRLQSGSQAASNGYSDLVHWIPNVQYSDIDCYYSTPDGQDDKFFDIGNALIYSNDNCARVPENRKIVVTATVSKPSVSDDISVKVVGFSDDSPQSVHVLAQTTILSDDWQVGRSLTIADNGNSQNIRVELSAKSNINWISPQFSFLVDVYHSTTSSVVDTSLTCPYKIVPLTKMVYAGEEFNTGDKEVIRIRPNAVIMTPDFPNDTVFLSVKTSDRLVWQKAYTTVSLQSVQYVDVPLSGYDAGDVWFEYSFPGAWTNDYLSQPYVSVYDTQSGSTQNVKAAFFAMRDDERFGPMFRGWGGFVYNAGNGRYAQPIDETLLTMPTDSASANPLTMALLPMYADTSGSSPMMRGVSDRLYFNSYSVRTGRIGLQDVSFGNRYSGSRLAVRTAGGDGIAVTQKSINTSNVNQSGISNGTRSKANGENVTKRAMIDMNGDGYPDLVTDRAIQYSTVLGGLGGRYYSENGMMRTENESNAIGAGGGVVPSVPGVSYFKGVKESGNTFFAKALSTLGHISLDVNESYNLDATVNGFFDINGDGLPDKFSTTSEGARLVSLNTGYGFAEPIPWQYGDIRINRSAAVNLGGSGNIDIASSSLAAGITYVTTTGSDLAALEDINGDGLPDLLTAYGNDLMVRLNTGNGFADATTLSGVHIGITQSTSESVNTAFTKNIVIPSTPPSMVSVSPSGSVSQSVSRTRYALMDVDGDGFTDIVSSDSPDILHVRYSAIGRTNKLKSVTNPLGGTFTIDYAHADASYDLPGGKWIMSAVEVDDGIDADGPVMRSRFEYEGGRRDRREREFLGFATVSTVELDTENNDAEYRRTVETYDNRSYYHQGMLTSTAVISGNSTLSENTTTYYTYEAVPSGSGWTLSETATVDDHGSCFVAPKYAESRLDGTVMTQALNMYNTTGSHGEITDYYYSDKGTMSSSTGSGCDYHTEIGYDYTSGNAACHVYGQPTSVAVSESGGTFHYTTAEYDSGNPTHLVSVTRKLNNTQSAITTFEYDQYGNVTKKTMPDNSLWYSYNYDNEVCMYVEQITDAFGLSSSAEHNYEYGVTTKTTDANNAYTKTIFDKKGRLKSISLPNDNQEAASMEISYTPKYGTTPAHATTSYYLRQGNGYNQTDTKESVSYVDGFGKIVQKRTQGKIGRGNGYNVIVDGRCDHDAFGRIVRKHYPGASNSLSTFRMDDQYENYITYSYDPLDRVVLERQPDNSSTSTEYSVGYNTHLLKTSITDAMQHTTDVYSNGSGRTVKTVRYNGSGGFVQTQYAYDGIGRNTEVTDAGGNTTYSTYDMGDRLVSVNHPASGTTSFLYDEMDNVVRKTTAENEQVTYSYDRGRLTYVSYPDHPANNISYHYGDNASSFNRRGRLLFVEDGAGGTEYEYDNMGNVSRTLRTVVIPGHGKATFDTSWTYDNFGKLLQMTYPDGGTLTYRYDSYGRLQQVYKGTSPGDGNYYLKEAAYDVFGRRYYMKYGNDVETTLEYNDERQWLDYMTVKKGSNTLMDREYLYFKQGNIKKISDAVTSLEHHYEYDDMDRLTQASGSWGSPSLSDYTQYATTTSYDDLYRITGRTVEREWPNRTSGSYRGYGMAYTYQSDNPFHLHSVLWTNYQDSSHAMLGYPTGRGYSYDQKGNLKQTGGNNTYRWDEDGHLMAAKPRGAVGAYICGADGVRVYRMGMNSISIYSNGTMSNSLSVFNYKLYPNEYFVFYNGSHYSKHVYIDGERIATTVGSTSLSNYSHSGTVLAGTSVIGNAYVDNFYYSKRSDQEEELSNSFTYFGMTLNVSDMMQNMLTTSGVPSDNLVYFFHKDHLGSSCMITDNSGNVVQQIEYLPEGDVFVENITGSYETEYRFNGKEYDGDTQMYYFGARYYDKELGIWISPDPLELDYPGISSYAYCAGNPVNRVDIDGKKILPVYISNINESGQSIGVRYLSNTKVINAMKVFGKTTYGKSLLESFVPKGFSQYGVKGNGKYSKYVLKILEVDIPNNHQRYAIIGKRKGWLDIEEKNGTLFFVMGLDVSDLSSNELIETIVHELTLHGYNIDNTIRAFEKGGFKSAKKVFFSTPPSLEHNDVNESVHKYGGGLYNKTKEEILNVMPQMKKEFNK